MTFIAPELLNSKKLISIGSPERSRVGDTANSGSRLRGHQASDEHPGILATDILYNLRILEGYSLYGHACVLPVNKT